MQIAEQQELREKTTALIIDWANNRKPPFTGETADGFTDAIEAAHLVADEGRLSLQRWVDAARRTGLSWTEIGEALGISKQAAQQRFKSSYGGDEPAINADEEIIRLGAHAFNEMKIMRSEGANGNELVRTGPLTLVFRPTAQNWEYRRTIGSGSSNANMKKDGWTHVSTWLPFQYFKRPLA